MEHRNTPDDEVLRRPLEPKTLIAPPQVQEVIRSAEAQQQEFIDRAGGNWSLSHGPLVFTTPLGTPIDPDNYRHQVSKLAKSVGIGHTGTHTLRRSAGSFLYAMGVQMKDISAVLGHSSTRVTEELYVFLLEGSRAASAKAIEQALWKD